MSSILDHIRDVKAEFPSIDLITVVSEFKKVFLTDLPGMPSDIHIDFCLDLKHDNHPTFILLYRVTQQR